MMTTDSEPKSGEITPLQINFDSQGDVEPRSSETQQSQSGQ